MAAEPAASDVPRSRVPGYAWDWVQRSRPIVERLAQTLTGAPPRTGFVRALRRAFAQDPLVRDVVMEVIAEAAFRGRVPTSRPQGVSWDRGLTWWAAALAGVDPSGFESRASEVEQRRLFDPAHASDGQPQHDRERRALAAALRRLVDASDGREIPVVAVRQLIADLETPREPE